MIENSDNDSATDLFEQDGSAPGLTAYNNDLGLKQTTPNVDWGDTTTSAADQVTLVRELLSPGTLLTSSARGFQRTLMRHVESDQRWGISGGVPKSAVIGNKNGWLPVDEDHDLWAVNSIGWVQGDGKSYVIAVITQHDVSEGLRHRHDRAHRQAGLEARVGRGTRQELGHRPSHSDVKGHCAMTRWL